MTLHVWLESQTYHPDGLTLQDPVRTCPLTCFRESNGVKAKPRQKASLQPHLCGIPSDSTESHSKKENYSQPRGAQCSFVIKSFISTGLTEPKEPRSVLMETDRQEPICKASQAPWEQHVILPTADRGNQRRSSYLFLSPYLDWELFIAGRYFVHVV